MSCVLPSVKHQRRTERISEFTTDLVQFDYKQCRHDFWVIKKRVDRRREFSLRCSLCNSMIEDGRDSKMHQLATLAIMFRDGKSTQCAAIESGYPLRTIKRYFGRLATWTKARGIVVATPFKLRKEINGIS